MKVDYPFSSHMVIQRYHTITISGTSLGKSITLSFCSKEYQCEVVDGRWSISFYVEYVEGPFNMVITSEIDMLILEDILVGDVFLAAGQSNMEMKMSQVKDSFDKSYRDDIRVLRVPQYVYPFVEEDLPWEVINDDNIGEISALSTFFAYALKSDVPIGIIINNKGGSSASCWIREEDLKQDKDIEEVYVQRYMRNLPSVEQQKIDMEEYYQEYQEYQQTYDVYQKKHLHMSVAQIKNIIGHTPWPPPKGIYDFSYPSRLYYHMFQRTLHYPICAVLYYQGEEDAKHSYLYEKLLHLLICNWREDYHEMIPFFIIQLPEFENSHFHEIRLAQKNVCDTMDRVYLVVSLLTGEKDNIHPIYKKELASRLASHVSHYLYHQDKPVTPQIVKTYQRDDFIIEFDQSLIEQCVHVMVDQQMICATIKDNQLIVPVSTFHDISYACSDVPCVEIMSQQGMPASPFVIQK